MEREEKANVVILTGSLVCAVWSHNLTPPPKKKVIFFMLFLKGECRRTHCYSYRGASIKGDIYIKKCKLTH